MISITLFMIYFLIIAFTLVVFNFDEIKKAFLKTKNEKEGKYVKICPKCGSLKIQVDFSNPVVWAYGTTFKYKCKSCRHLSNVFPEVLEEDIEKYRKELKAQIKEGKLSFKKEDMIDASAGFSIGMFEVITGIIIFWLLSLIIFIERDIGVISSLLLVYFFIILYLIFKIYRRRKNQA